MSTFDAQDGFSQAPALAADLRRRRPSLPPEAQPHASNLIEQLDGIKTPADLERLRPFMARSMRLLEASQCQN